MMDNKEALLKELQVCALHVDRIEKALAEIMLFLPLTKEKIEHFSVQELAITELLTSRFAKLQDAMGEKLFPLYLTYLGEDIVSKSFIDRLNRLEKLGIIPASNRWFQYRRARNAIAHEYPDSIEMTLSNLNEVLLLSKELIGLFYQIQHRIE